jgi:transcriptional regulator with XRE-family HTH domain
MRELRLQRRLSQAKLGRLINWAYQQVGKYESGEYDLRVTDLPRVATALNVTIDELLTVEPRLRPEERELVDLFRASAPEDRQRLLEIARVLHRRPAAAE